MHPPLRFRTLRWVSALALGFGLLSAVAGPSSADLSPTVRITEGGQTRAYQVALDELAVTGPQPRTLTLSGVKSLAELQTRAAQWQAGQGAAPAYVLYPVDAPSSEFTRRVATPQVAVRLVAGADAPALAKTVGATTVSSVAGLPGWWLFAAPSANESLALAARLGNQPAALDVQPQLGRRHAPKRVPNDFYFWQLWHLRNTGLNQGLAGMDVQVTNVWNTWRGAGMVIGVVDDGIQAEHPDLAANFDASLSTNFNAGPFDLFYDDHGTRVAGAAAACGDNSIGITGAAYEAKLASLRLIGFPWDVVDAHDAAAMLHRNDAIQVKNNSWGGQDADVGRASILEGPGPLMAQAITTGVAEGRAGLGTLYLFAGGNGGAYGDDVNYDGFANQVGVIAVGAVDDRGVQASFSEPGACLTVCAPSGSGREICYGGRQRIVTTDLIGLDGLNFQFASCELPDRDYSQNFSGTSAATPIASGVVALLLQAHPQLGWRDVKEILLRSATRCSPTDPDWATNSAGVVHNHKFGGGLINADKAIQLGTNWVNVGPQTTLTSTVEGLSLPVPDDTAAGLTQQFAITDANFRVEQVRLTLDLPHGRYGDLEITLTSPSGMVSRLASPHNTADAGYYGWSFTSVRHWGENAAGTWTLKMADLRAGQTGTLNRAQLELLGSQPVKFWMTSTADSLPVLHATYNAPMTGCQNFVFEASTNLTDWAGIATNQLCTGGSAQFTDTNSVSIPHRFYRLRW